MAAHVGSKSCERLFWLKQLRGRLIGYRNRAEELLLISRTKQKYLSIVGATYKHARCLRAILPAFVTVHALSLPGFSKKEQAGSKEEKVVVDEVAAIISKADQLYHQNEVLQLYDYLLAFKEQENDEILWRLARAAVDKGKHSSDDKEKQKLYFEAFDYIKKALTLNDKNFAVHKWYAILLDYTGEYEGTKQRISNAYQVKTHFLKSIELNPTDATSIHSLGYWCFVFADMPWYQKKIASALFATPPTSSYDEALKYFLLAEETDPNFYSTNLLMLGKTYLRMKNNKMALIYLQRTKEFPVKTPDDRKAHEEALQLLKGLGATDSDNAADR